MRPDYGKQREFWNETMRDKEVDIENSSKSDINLFTTVIFVAIFVIMGVMFFIFK